VPQYNIQKGYSKTDVQIEEIMQFLNSFLIINIIKNKKENENENEIGTLKRIKIDKLTMK